MLKFFIYNFGDNMTSDEIKDSIRVMIEGTKQYERMEEIMLFVIVPTLSLETVCAAFDRTYVKISSQRFSLQEKPPITGEQTLQSLKAVGVDIVICGLADNRYQGAESNEIVAKKLDKGLAEGLKMLFCVGEDKTAAENGTSFALIKEQLVAGVREIPLDAFYRCGTVYRPLWAFDPEEKGFGDDYDKKMLAMIRETVAEERPDFPEPLPLFYGGVIVPEIARNLLCTGTVDGVMVDSFRMDAETFTAFVNSCYSVSGCQQGRF